MPQAVRLVLVLGLLASATARAEGTAVWLEGQPDPTLVRVSHYLDADQAAPTTTWSDRDQAAVDALEQELAAVRPLLDVFDGELQILRRLEAAVEAVGDLQEEDRALLHDARAFQGLAAARYYQAALATDPSAEPWRLELPDGSVVNRLFADAIAVDAETLPSAEVVPDDDARLAYQEVRARLLVVPDAAVEATDLPPGGLLVVDGVANPTGRARVLPGEHRVRIEQDGAIRLQQIVRLDSGASLVLPTPADGVELRAFGQALDGSAAVPLPPRVRTSLEALEQPVTLVVQERGQPVQYRVVDGAAIPLVAADPGSPTRTRRDSGLSVRAGLSAAWLYDGEWYLQNASAGAPEATATVNGLAPGLHLGLEQRWGLLAVGLGADARYSLGQWQDLRVGETDWRLRLYPHLAAGLPWVQLTAGAWLPWRVGLGARAHLPLAGPVELDAGLLTGPGPGYTAADGSDFQPTTALSAWGGLSVRLGG